MCWCWELANTKCYKAREILWDESQLQASSVELMSSITCMNTSTYMRTCVCIYTCMCVDISMYIRVYIYSYVHVCMYFPPSFDNRKGLRAKMPHQQCVHLTLRSWCLILKLLTEMADSKAKAGKREDEPETPCYVRK